MRLIDIFLVAVFFHLLEMRTSFLQESETAKLLPACNLCLQRSSSEYLLEVFSRDLFVVQRLLFSLFVLYLFVVQFVFFKYDIVVQSLSLYIYTVLICLLHIN